MILKTSIKLIFYRIKTQMKFKKRESVKWILFLFCKKKVGQKVGQKNI